jgi:hypothetical protein
VSPILVRPVREQLEHDRVIRTLQGRFRRRYEVGINPGAEQNAAIGTGPSAMFPDLVLSRPDRGHRMEAIVEVETAESVNHLEAMAQWARFAKFKAPLHLYVPASAVDSARRLCADHGIVVTEFWSYHTVADQLRFTMIHRAPVERRPEPRPAPRQSRTAAAPRKRAAAKSAARGAKKAARGQKRR